MLIVDQQSAGDMLGVDFQLAQLPKPSPWGAPAGQEFVPTAAELNAVDLDLRGLDAYIPPGSGPSDVVSVRIRIDTITGPIVGTSQAVSLPDPGSVSFGTSLPFSLVRFDFPGPVPLEPGQRHVIEIVPIAGRVGGMFLYAQDGDSYPKGRCILGGQPFEVLSPKGGRASLWFREGFEVATPAGARWAATIMYILFGVIQDGVGLGYLPSGKPIPIDPMRSLNPATQQALAGLAVRELASAIDDATIRRTVEHAGLDMVRASVRQLEEGH